MKEKVCGANLPYWCVFLSTGAKTAGGGVVATPFRRTIVKVVSKTNIV